MKHITGLIEEGEHQHLDFKYSIDDMRKIAKTLVAFANSGGGRLLVGVKDNGKIKGCRPLEEIHMLEFAAEEYCQPKIEVEFAQHTVDGKVVLEALVADSPQKPHKALIINGKPKAYTRVIDQVLPMPATLFLSMKLKNDPIEKIFRYSEIEKNIISFIDQNVTIEYEKIIEQLNLNRSKANKTISHLIHFGVIKLNYQQNKWLYSLNNSL